PDSRAVNGVGALLIPALGASRARPRISVSPSLIVGAYQAPAGRSAARRLLVTPDGPAVHVDRLPGDPLAPFAREEDHHLRALGTVARVPERDHPLDELLPLLAAPKVVHSERIDDPRADRVHTDLVWRQLDCQRTCQRVDARLRSCVRGSVRRRELARDGRDVDDAAAFAL